MWRWLLRVDPQVFWAPGPAVPPVPFMPVAVGGFAALEAGWRRVAGVSWF